MRLAGAAAVAVATLAALAPAALAGPPGRWTQVTGVERPDPNTLDASLARTPDGVLHVGWVSAGSVLHTSISKDARRITRRRTVDAYGEGANDRTVILSTAEGLRMFFAGSPARVLSTSTSTDGGRTWTPAQAVSSGPAQAATGIAAARIGDGRYLTAWGSPGAGFHLGLDPAQPDGALPAGGPIDPGIGVDQATGEPLIASGLLDQEGIWYFVPGGAPVRIPGSGAVQLRHPVAVTGRIGAAGVFVAYTRGRSEFLGRAAVWDVAAGKSTMLGRSPGDLGASLAAAPGGRLWAFWYRRRPRALFAVRSNPEATRFGRIVRVRPPEEAKGIHELIGDGSAGPLDALMLVERRGSVGNWHRRVLPGLSLTAKVGRNGSVGFSATDAGDALSGVRVTLDGRSRTTDATGVARFALGEGSYRAIARRRGYSPASVRVRVR